MPKPPDFDLKSAHRFFAADCFNRAWDLIEKPDRTPDDDRQMVALSQASIFHWRCRPDVTDRNLSVGHWQVSRVYALLGQAVEARRNAEISLGYAKALKPFVLGYAYEALARAALLAGDRAEARTFLDTAQALADEVGDAEDRALLQADLTALSAAAAA
jgi:hypothetical protein